MKYLHNIEKSMIRPREYVGYGGGFVFRVRKHGAGGWEAVPRLAKPEDWPIATHWPRAATLTELSASLECLPLPAVDRSR
jgi:hypothetical protein